MLSTNNIFMLMQSGSTHNANLRF